MAQRTLAEILRIYRSADTDSREDHCFAITPILVNGGELSPAQVQMVADLDHAIDSAAPTETNLVLYRGCRPRELVHAQPYLSFLSTSTDLMETFDFCDGCLIRFEMPPASKVLRVVNDNIGVSVLEPNERLMPRGMRFRLDDWILDAEEQLRVSISNIPNASFVRAIPL